MHAYVIIIGSWFDVPFLCAESSHSISKHEYLERVARKDKNVYSKVEFEAIYKIWTPHVSLYYESFFSRYIFKSSSYENSFSLARCFRLYNHWDNFLLGDIVFEIIEIIRQIPSFRSEFEVFLKMLFHSLNILCQEILSTNLICSRKMVELLVVLHPLKSLIWHSKIRPKDVPVLPFVVWKLPAYVLRCLFDHVILSVWSKSKEAYFKRWALLEGAFIFQGNSSLFPCSF